MDNRPTNIKKYLVHTLRVLVQETERRLVMTAIQSVTGCVVVTSREGTRLASICCPIPGLSHVINQRLKYKDVSCCLVKMGQS